MSAYPASDDRQQPAPHHAGDSTQFDRELDIRAIVWSTVVGAVITLACAVAMWGLMKGFNSFDVHHAPPPPPMADAMRQTPPAEPRLQNEPTTDMDAMKASTDQTLSHAGWIDQAQGTLRVPIDVAIDVIAARGLPHVTTPTLAAMTAHGSMEADGRPPTDQPSPGTLLPPPGMGYGHLGPPAAGAGQVMSPAMPETPMSGAAAPAAVATAPGSAARPASPIVPPASGQRTAPATPANPTASPAPVTPTNPSTPTLPPPPAGGRR